MNIEFNEKEANRFKEVFTAVNTAILTVTYFENCLNNSLVYLKKLINWNKQDVEQKRFSKSTDTSNKAEGNDKSVNEGIGD